MELKDTVELMLSDDYKDRFKAEYYQLRIRVDKLAKMLIKWEAGTLNFKPSCSKQMFEKQIDSMAEYLHVLRIRAEIEGIEL